MIERLPQQQFANRKLKTGPVKIKDRSHKD